MGAVRRLLVVRWLLVRRLLAVADQMELGPFGWRVRSLPGVLLAAAGQMELAPFGWRAERRPGVLLVSAGQMELAPFGSSL